ncbi:MAG: 4a-hydroxytetrahydrobiopterin dehydratase [Planctomycetota bacterium]|nr:4a-hydroxytetrahydrobiopterin dehydratase [Planctomycetota bacterium]
MKMTPVRATESEVAAALAGLPQWRRDGDALAATFRFPRFRDAVRFTTEVAEVAEEMDHHPEWRVVYRVVDVSMTTHDVGGLSTLDFQLAGRVAALAAALGAAPAS